MCALLFDFQVAIEISSVSGRGTVAKKPRQPSRGTSPTRRYRRRRVFLTCASLLVLVTLATATIALQQSYRFYSGLIDARLASGYLTSRPGIYAAPRSISAGQKVPRDDFVRALRRAGYTEGDVSDVWSGSFTAGENFIEIHPGRVQLPSPNVVRVVIDASGRVAELTGDGTTLDSFTLEPEVLTNDLSTKNGRRAQLTYHELPPVLVHAILSIEDRRFFEHRGLDLFGVVRALLRNVGDDRIGQGGSTITQQLVKNTYLSPERTYSRKFAEAMLALRSNAGFRRKISLRSIATKFIWASAAQWRCAESNRQRAFTLAKMSRIFRLRKRPPLRE